MKCIKTATEIATQNTDELNSITNNLKNSLLNDPPEIELVLFSFVVEFVISILHKNFGKKEAFLYIPICRSIAQAEYQTRQTQVKPKKTGNRRKLY
jgi:hypothetical protein